MQRQCEHGQKHWVHEWRLPPLKELISIPSLPSFLLLSTVWRQNQTSSISSRPIRSRSSTQPLKPDKSDWTEKGELRAGRGRGVPHSLSLSLSPALCFSLTVCDSSWMSDCSHTLSPTMVDHIPSLLHLTPPHPSHSTPTPTPPHPLPTPSPPEQHMGLWELLFPNGLLFTCKPSLLSAEQN